VAYWDDLVTYQLNQKVRLDPAILETKANGDEYFGYETPSTRYYTCIQGPIANCHPILGNLADATDLNNSSTYWIDAGPAKAWAMFDTSLSSVTSKSNLTFELFAPNNIAFFGARGLSVTVTVKGSGTYYVNSVPKTFGANSILGSVTVPLTSISSDFSILGLYYLNADCILADNIVITFTGNAYINTVVVGDLKDLGPTEYGATLGITDYSKKTTDVNGVTTFIKRAYSKRLSVRAMFDNSSLKTLYTLLAELRSTPCVWLTVEDSLDTSGNFTVLNTFGYYQSFSIEIAYTNQSYCSLEIEGLA